MMNSHSPHRRLTVLAILLLLAAGVAMLVSPAEDEVVNKVPTSDRQIPVRGQVLESDRPDLLEEPVFVAPDEEVEDR